jgi:hypothetical protein
MKKLDLMAASGDQMDAAKPEATKFIDKDSLLKVLKSSSCILLFYINAVFDMKRLNKTKIYNICYEILFYSVDNLLCK